MEKSELSTLSASRSSEVLLLWPSGDCDRAEVGRGGSGLVGGAVGGASLLVHLRGGGFISASSLLAKSAFGMRLTLLLSDTESEVMIEWAVERVS